MQAEEKELKDRLVWQKQSGCCWLLSIRRKLAQLVQALGLVLQMTRGFIETILC